MHRATAFNVVSELTRVILYRGCVYSNKGSLTVYTHLGGGRAHQEVGSQAAQAAAAATALSAQHACACTTWSHSGQDSSVVPGARASLVIGMN